VGQRDGTGVTGGATTDGHRASARSVIVGRDGRAKAYRPLSAADRAAAIEAGLAAYDRGDFFLAHEDLEPAWMGTADLGERALLQGLIKLAAAYVHAVRGNPAGIERNLAGARRRLTEPGTGEAAVSLDHLDLDHLVDDIDRRLADLVANPAGPLLGPPVLRRSAP
jgi:predicted metal-dependent hydrolase